MTENVIQGHFGPESPHVAGTARCLECKHQWTAVAPAGTHQLECPACKTMKGVWRSPMVPGPDQQIWQCSCGCDLFMVLRTGFMCHRCGQEQTF